MIIADSSAWIAVSRGLVTPVAIALATLLRDGVPVYLTDVVYTELRSVKSDHARQKVGRLVHADRIVRLQHLDDFERAARCRRAAAKHGTPVRSITDCLIASVCIREDAVLLHDDRDFRALASCTELRELVP